MTNEYIQCSHTRKCKWIGLESEMDNIPSEQHPYINATDMVCPKCGNPEHYVLTEDEFNKLKAKQCQN